MAEHTINQGDQIYNQAIDILHTWKTDAKINKNIHNATANYYWKINKIITIPLLAIMAASGTTLLSTFSSDPNDKTIAIVSGVLVTVSAFIQTLLVFLGLDDKETTHRNTARLYQQVLDESDTFNIINPSYESITQFLHHIDVIRKIATAIKYEPPRWVYYQYANELLNDDIREEIRRLSTRSSVGQPHQILSFQQWIDTSADSPVEDIHPVIASDINHRTNYWDGSSIAVSVQEARDNIYKMSGIHHL